MLSKIFCLTLLSASLNVTVALADGIRIDIKNSYDETLNFGPLGKGTRDGIDTAEGVLNRQGAEVRWNRQRERRLNPDNDRNDGAAAGRKPTWTGRH